MLQYRSILLYKYYDNIVVMNKRRILDLQKEIYRVIKENPGITMSRLERKIKTNPSSLNEHCRILEHWGVIKIEKLENTRKLFIS